MHRGDRPRQRRPAAGRSFTVTGRLRERHVQQRPQLHLPGGGGRRGDPGPVAGLRAGHTLVDFVHDQDVVESPADDRVPGRVAEIEELMGRGMLMIVPGMDVKVETVVTRSLNKKDLDPRYHPEAGTATAAPSGGAT